MLCHFDLLLVAVVAADVADDGDTGTDGAQSTGLAILHSDRLLSRLIAHLEGVEVDGGVRLRGRRGERGGSAEDTVGVEKPVLPDLLDGGLNTTESGRGDHRHVVLALVVELLEFFASTDTGLRLRIELGDDLILLFLHEPLQLVRAQLKLVLGLERDHHATEVLAHEILDELVAGVAVGNVVLLKDLIGKIGAGFEGQLLREDQGVVAIEEDLGDLRGASLVSRGGGSTIFIGGLETRILTLGMMAGILYLDWRTKLNNLKYGGMECEGSGSGCFW